MAKVMLGYPNKIDDATLSGGSWETTLPLTNLQTLELGHVARTTDTALASTTFDVTFAYPESIRALGLFNHNLSTLGTCRWIGSNVADYATLLYDGGELDAWPVVFPQSILNWYSPNWWNGKYTVAQRAGYTPAAILPMPSEIVAKYWRCIISDVSNPAGFIQIGRPFVGPAYQPRINMVYGCDLGWEPTTIVQRLPAGGKTFDVRRPFRVKNFSLKNMQDDEAISWALELQRQAGLHGEVLYIDDPDDTVHALPTRFLANLRTLSPIENPGYNRNATIFALEEKL